MILINKKLLVLLLAPITLNLSACAAIIPLASATYVTVASSAAASQTTKHRTITNRSDTDTLKDHNLATQVNSNYNRENTNRKIFSSELQPKSTYHWRSSH